MIDELPEPVWTGRKRRDGPWVTDSELIERLGLPEKVGRRVLHAYDENPRLGFPQKQPFFGGRRYWPAIEDYLDKNYRSGYSR